MSSSFASAALSAGSSAVPGAGIAVSVLKIGISELAQHSARLAGATSENQAAEQAIPAYDADLAAINAAYNAGQISKAQAIAALEAVDGNVYKYLRAQVGKPGTAWSGGPPNYSFVSAQPLFAAFGGVPCTKACTVGCCIYYNDLHLGVLYCIAILSGWPGVDAFTTTATNWNCNIPEIYGDKYGFTTRPSYTLYWLKNPPVGNAAQVSATVDALLGAPAIAPPGPTPAATTSVLGKLTSNEALAIFAVVGGIIVVITALFGQNALRVNR
jgi:hypothetical protein